MKAAPVLLFLLLLLLPFHTYADPLGHLDGLVLIYMLFKSVPFYLLQLVGLGLSRSQKAIPMIIAWLGVVAGPVIAFLNVQLLLEEKLKGVIAFICILCLAGNVLLSGIILYRFLRGR